MVRFPLTALPVFAVLAALVVDATAPAHADWETLDEHLTVRSPSLVWDEVRHELVMMPGPYVWEDNQWHARHAVSGPGPSGTIAAWDGVRGEIIVFGTTGDTWSWDGLAWQRLTPAVAPTPRTRHCMAWDPDRREVVLFGGFQTNISTRLGDTWVWDGWTWRRRDLAQAPSARELCGMAYDKKRQLMLMVGGTDSTGLLTNAWTWDGETWSQIASTSAVSAPALAYDETRQQVLRIGGSGAQVVTGWNGTTWVAAPSLAVGRVFQGAAFDPEQQALVVHGGFDPTVASGDTLALTDTWRLLRSAPQPRFSALLAADTARGRVVLFGGTGATTFADTWEWDGVRWLLQSPPLSPSARTNAAMTYDVANARTVLFGGSAGAETWMYNGTTWSLPTLTGTPSARSKPVLAYDATRGEVVLFGGSAGGGETWILRGLTWTQRLVSGPPARHSAHMAFDPVRQEMVLFGGVQGTLDVGPYTYLADTWVWNGASWAQRTPSASPLTRLGGAFAWSSDVGALVLQGGVNSGFGFQPQTWSWTGSDWSNLGVNGAQARNRAAVSDVHSGGIIVFGGTLSNETGSSTERFSSKLALGGGCATGTACISGSCVDGVCCNAACGGGVSDCMACSVAAGGLANGSCTALSVAVAPTVTCRAASGPGDVATMCVDTSRFCTPGLVDDAVTVARGDTVVIDVLANDSIDKGGRDYALVTIVALGSGRAEVIADGVRYEHHGSATEDAFEYEVCDLSWPPRCNTAVVHIEVTQETVATTLFALDSNVGNGCDSFGGAGGTRVRSGRDDGLPSGSAGDGVLQADEVEATAFLCNGAAGADGADGQDGTNGTNGTNGFDVVVLADDQVGVQCPAGGLRVRAGRDDGVPSGVARDGVLQAGEVETSAVVCHGRDGADGTNGQDGEDGATGATGATGAQGPTGATGAPGAAGSDGFFALVTTDTSVGSACDALGGNGGTRIRSGLDDGAPGGTARNGMLEASEVDASAYVCNGAGAGSTGPAGPAGPAGPGGQDGTNGSNGTDGTDGKSSLVATDTQVGAACASGGIRVRSGLDDSGDGVLQAAEVDATAVVCNGATGAVGPRGEAGADGETGAAGDDGFNTLVASDADIGGACDAYGNGGTRVASGLDDGSPSGVAGDGVLQGPERDQQFFVCNGADGADGQRGAAILISVDDQVGAACDAFAGTGRRLRTGVDDDGDGALAGAEVDATSVVCDGRAGVAGAAGDDGHGLLVTASEVSACPHGGRTLTLGADDGLPGGTADDGLLDTREVDATVEVCDGAPGSDGTNGTNGTNGSDGKGVAGLVSVTPDDGTRCDAGGVLIQSGLDDGAPGGTAGDGVLDAAEVDDVQAVCNGGAGDDGAGGGCNGGATSLVGLALAWVARRRR